MDDPNLGVDGASEGAEGLEVVPEEVEETPTTPEPSGDPLDDIKDEAARAEAKKARAIARRQVKPEPAQPATPSPEFLTKAEFYKSNEKKARVELEKDPETKAILDKAIPYYVARNGKDTVEGILEDMGDALALYRIKNPVVETDDSARGLTSSAIIKAGGGSIEKGTPKTPAPPNFKLPSKPSEWYAKK